MEQASLGTSRLSRSVADAVLLAIDEVDAGIANVPVFNSGCGILPLIHSNPVAAARLDRG